jgi:protein-tyrosine kinase
MRIHDALARAATSGEHEKAPDSATAPRELLPSAISADGLADLQARETGRETVWTGSPSHPAAAGQAAKAAFSSTVAEKLVVDNAVETTVVEQYRRLAAQLHLTQAERSIKVALVTSASGAEGKTLTAVNVALTLSESYRRRVLLVDGDLRRPRLHEVFHVPNVCGLNEGLRPDAQERVRLVEVYDHLTLLTAGRPESDPMSVLSSERMQKVIEEAKARFDWVIVDTPPVGLLTDAHLLASMVDAVLLVIHAGRTPFNAIRRTVDVLGKDKILGVVLNRASKSASKYAYQDAAAGAAETVNT